MFIERFETRMFSQLIGDWAISIFSEARQELILARDFIGSRPLFYRTDKHQITWSTVLEPLVFLARSASGVCGPILPVGCRHFHIRISRRMKVSGVFLHPPLFEFEPAQTSVRKYWNFDPARRFAIAHDQGL